MQYVGSKRKIAKEILPIILNDRKSGQYYVEPFAGGFNSISLVSNPRIAGDVHGPLISLIRSLQNGWEPPENISKEEYYAIKKSPNEYPDCLVGFVGFLCSFGGKWWGGYAKNNAGRNYALEGKKSLLKQKPLLMGIEIYHLPYWQLPIPANSIIYCDPPYQSTTKYSGTGSFDHEKFWAWCLEKHAEGHKIYVSEYAAPIGFQCVWSKKITSTLGKDSNSLVKVERLFVPD